MCKIEVRGTCRGGVAEHAEGDGSDRGRVLAGGKIGRWERYGVAFWEVFEC